MTAPASEPADGPRADLPSMRTKLPVEPGERFDAPHRWGDPFEIPATRSGRVTRRDPLGVGGDAVQALERLRLAMRAADRTDKYAPRGPAPDPAPEPSAEEARLDHLRYLARWVVGTVEDARARIDALEQKASEYRAAKASPSAGLVAALEQARRHLAECQERDAIQATRPEGCRCTGSGAWGGQIAITVVVGTDLDGNEQLYAEGIDGPMTYSEICRACPEGEAVVARNREQQDAMRQRWARKRLERLLGAARIPPRLINLDLSTYPHREIARKVWRWYSTHLREQRARLTTRSLREFLLLFGPNTRGKTGVAIGVMKLALDRGQAAVFRTTIDLLDELRATYDEKNDACHAEILAALKAAPLLILDDLGAERLTGYASDVLQSLLDHRRNELRPTILTTNLDPISHDEQPSELARWLGQRVYDRTAGRTNSIDFGGLPILEDAAPSPPPTDDFEDW